MAESKATAPEFVITCEVDMQAAVEFRKQLKAAAGEDGVAPSFNDFVVKASALALKEFPRANGAYRDGKFELYSRVNVGIAVAGQDALIVPTVFDADSKSIGQIARDARGLAERVREGKITPPELSSGTFSVSNLGMFGIKRFTAVINPPQAAILAVGEMTPRPVVRDGEVTVRPVMELTLTCDHRILYGADAAQFLGRIRERLENPLSASRSELGVRIERSSSRRRCAARCWAQLGRRAARPRGARSVSTIRQSGAVAARHARAVDLGRELDGVDRGRGPAATTRRARRRSRARPGTSRPRRRARRRPPGGAAARARG